MIGQLKVSNSVFSIFTGVSTITVSIAVILGWLLGVEWPLNIIADGPSMKFNTALLFLVLAVGVFQRADGQRYAHFIRLLSGAFVFLFAFVTLCQDVFGFSFHIDFLFVKDTLSDTSVPGRMSPATALSFMLLGAVFVMKSSSLAKNRLFIQNVLFVVTLISFVGLVGYALQISPEQKILPFRSMAFHTSFLFFIVSLSLLFENPDIGFPRIVSGKHEGSKMLRWLLPFNLLLPVMLGFLLLWSFNNGWIDLEYGIVIDTVIFTLLSLGYIVIVSMGLNKYDKKREVLEQSLKAANQELAHFKKALDENAIVVITNKDDSIEYVNDKFCEISQYSREELLGQTHRIVNSGHHPESFFREMWETISSGKPWVGEIKNKAKDGSFYWVFTSIVPFTNDDGEIYRYLSIRHDITQRKEVEQLLSSQYIPTLERKNKELEQFVFIASHDLQEPLRSVQSIVGLLEKEYKGKLDEVADEYLGFITKSTDRMADLIKGLLDYSRIGGKKILEEVDCNEILQEIQDDLGSYIASTNSKLTVDELPRIHVYRTELRLLFQNLINNAIKFRKKDVAPEIHVSAVRENGHWRFSIADNGIGIAPQHHQKIFTIFHRIHSRKDYDGTGIGLSHCQKIVGLFGGGIWVDSEPSHGSTFHFTIPINFKTYHETKA